MRKPIIGVMGGTDAGDRVVQLAERLGALIAARGWVLLNGGRKFGVMAASARGAKSAGGTTIGVLPDENTDGASSDIDYAIVTGLGDARNLVNVLSSDVVVACPGQAGTLSEVALALNHGKPVITLCFDVGPAFDAYRRDGLLTSADTPENAVEQAAAALSSRRDQST